MAEPIRILVVDPDDQAAAEYFSGLANEHRRIDRARTLSGAVSLAAKSSYDVAIIDMLLPDGVGTDAWDHLRSINPEMVGILTTSSRGLHDSINPAAGEVSAYLLKPFKMRVLRAYIADALAKAGADRNGLRADWRLPALPSWWPGGQTEPDYDWGRTRLAVPVGASVLVLVLVLLFGGAGVAWASQAALPGDSLYPVKTTVEGIQLALTPDNSVKVETLLGLTQIRTEEVNDLTAQGRSAGIEEAAGEYEAEVKSMTALLNVLARDDHPGANVLAKKVGDALSHSSTVLERVLAKVPEQAKPAIAHALAVSQEGKLNADHELENPGQPDQATPPLTATATGSPNPDVTPEQYSSPEPSETPVPLGLGQTPPGFAQTPPGLAQTPPGLAQTPPGLAQTPPGLAQTPPGLARTPPGQNQIPPGQNQTPPGQGKTPPGQNRTPGPKSPNGR